MIFENFETRQDELSQNEQLLKNKTQEIENIKLELKIENDRINEERKKLRNIASEQNKLEKDKKQLKLTEDKFNLDRDNFILQEKEFYDKQLNINENLDNLKKKIRADEDLIKEKFNNLESEKVEIEKK